MQATVKRARTGLAILSLAGAIIPTNVAAQERIEVLITSPLVGSTSKLDPALQAAFAIDAELIGSTDSGSVVLQLPPRMSFDAAMRRSLAAVPGFRSARRFTRRQFTRIDSVIVHELGQPGPGDAPRTIFVRRGLREPDVEATLRAEELRVEVRYIEPEYRYSLGTRAPERAPRVDDTQWALERIQAPRAWATVRHSSLLIAVLDTGVDIDHEDLVANLWHDPLDDTLGKSFDGLSSALQDVQGHGTAVSGLIAATGDNGIGIDGVVWGAEVITVKIFPDDGLSAATMDIANAIRYALEKGAKIINASWGGPNYSKAVHIAVQEAEAKGVLVVTIAGNGNTFGVGRELGDSWDPFVETLVLYPAMLPEDNVLVVMSTDDRDQRAYSSNFGLFAVDIAAPGVGLLSTTIDSGTGAATYDLSSGTSYAAAVASGAAALVWTHLGGPDVAGYADVKTALIEHAREVADLEGACAAQGVLDIGFVTPDTDAAGDADVTATDVDRASPTPDPPAPPGDRPESRTADRTWTGELMHPVVAIGGETTGTALRVGERTFELDLDGLRPRPDLEKLAGRRIQVTGTLSVENGVEITTRRIIRVTRIASTRGR